MHAPATESACPFTIGESFTKTFVFDSEGITTFATMAGDMNPLHHDREIAEASRFKSLIASGTQTSSVMLGALATYVSARASAVGLEFSVRLKKAIRAGETTKLTWTISSIEEKTSLSGDIVVFEGTLYNQEGVAALSATALNLVFRS
ncbi:MaoC family dehydratase [Microbacteriaceae bacterium K1510]|nr:MaoC family dehydratase [Microbacteriaceae bacterium K1510]